MLDSPVGRSAVTEIRLNVGCGSNPLPDYVNIDMDTLDQIRRRYPQKHFQDSIVVRQYDVFKLPYADGTVAEVRADSFLEHLPLADEPRFLYEVRRVLRPGGRFIFSVPDFEEVCRLFLAAKEDWKDFWRNDDEAIRQDHWFGNYSPTLANRWGYLVTIFFGAQNSPGMFHCNAYTEGKVRAIADRLGFEVAACERFRWKGDRDPMLRFELMQPV